MAAGDRIFMAKESTSQEILSNTRDWTENNIPTDNRRAGNRQESTSQKRGNT